MIDCRGDCVGVDAKLDQPAHPEASAGDCVIAAWPVASFAPAALEVVARFELEEPAHFGFGKLAREIEVTGVTINAANIFGLRKEAYVGIVIAGVRAHPREAGEATCDG